MYNFFSEKNICPEKKNDVLKKNSFSLSLFCDEWPKHL